MRSLLVFSLAAGILCLGGEMSSAADQPAPAQAEDERPEASDQKQAAGKAASDAGKGGNTGNYTTKDNDLIFTDGFETGDTSAWEICTSIFFMPTSLKD